MNNQGDYQIRIAKFHAYASGINRSKFEQRKKEESSCLSWVIQRKIMKKGKKKNHQEHVVEKTD